MNDPYGNEGLRHTALQNALNGYPIQHQQQQHFFAQHLQMVQPGNNGQQQQQVPAQLRNIVPRDGQVYIQNNMQRVIALPQQGRPTPQIAFLSNGQIAALTPNSMAYIPDPNGRPLAAMVAAQTRSLPPGTSAYLQTGGMYPVHMATRPMRIPHQMIQQQQRQFQLPQFQRQQPRPRQIVQATRETLPQNELITLSPTPSPPPNQAEAEEPTDMPVLDRQDADSQEGSSTSDSEDETTGYNRSLFLRESDEFHRASGGRVIEHLTAGGRILEADRPFDTRIREFDNVEDAIREVAHRVRTGRASAHAGRPVGRPRKVVKEEIVQPVQDRRRKKDNPRPTVADKAPENGVKKRRRKIAESEKLKQMDFGPKAGNVIIPDKRLRSERRSTQKEDNTPPAPPRRRAPRRSRQDVETPVMRDSTEESEIEDEEMSDYEPAPTEKARATQEKRKSAEKITHCVQCGGFITRPNYQSPQFCSRECRKANMTAKKNNENTQRDRPSLGIMKLDNPVGEIKVSPPSSAQFEVIPKSGLRIPTTGQNHSRKRKEGEGAAGSSQVPTKSRLRHPPSAYKIVDLPGCGSKKKDSAEKEVTVKEESVTPKQTPPKTNRPGEPRMAQSVDPPQSKRMREDKHSVVSPTRPVQSPVVKTEPVELPPNPESWTVEQTCMYTNSIDLSMSEICAKYSLDGYILMHGGDRLDALRKKTFRMNSGSIVPFGPWKKLTKAMGEFLNELKFHRIPMVFFEDCPKDYQQVRDWASKFTDTKTGRLLEKYQIGELEMRSCTVEDLVTFVGLSYGSACKVIFVAEKNPEVKPNLTSLEEAGHSASWSCITHAINHGCWPNHDFMSWMQKNFGDKIAKRFQLDYVDMDVLYSLTTEELVHVYGLSFKETKIIHTYMKDLKERGGTPPNPLEDVYGVTATHLQSGTKEQQWRKLNEWFGRFIEDDMCELLHSKGVDSRLIFHLTLKELFHDIGVDFCAAKKIVEKCKVIKGFDDYSEDDTLELPDDFEQNWKSMTAQNLASFVKTFCIEGDERKLLAKKIDGSCLPYLTTTNMQDLGVKFVTAKNLYLRLEKAKVFEKLDALPANFGKLEGDQLEQWIVNLTSKETWERIKKTEMKARYFKFLTLDAMVELGITPGNALKILETVRRGKLDLMIAQPPGVPTEWTVDEVYNWVTSITDAKIAEKLRQNSIDGATIRDISQEEYLTEIEIPWSAYKVISAQFAANVNKFLPKSQ